MSAVGIWNFFARDSNRKRSRRPVTELISVAPADPALFGSIAIAGAGPVPEFREAAPRNDAGPRGGGGHFPVERRHFSGCQQLEFGIFLPVTRTESAHAGPSPSSFRTRLLILLCLGVLLSLALVLYLNFEKRHLEIQVQ